MERITWSTGKYGGHAGKAGKITVVMLSWHTKKTDPAYVVSTVLPMGPVPDWAKGADDLADAKRLAEKLVTVWLRTIGAQWIKEEDTK